MIHHGHAITVQMLEGGIAECCFHLQHAILHELNDIQAALAAIKANTSIQGLVVSFQPHSSETNDNNKPYDELLQQEKTDLSTWLEQANQVFNQLEDLTVPKVAILQQSTFDIALEIALCCEYRVMDQHSTLRLTQHQHGIMPYLGGMIRLPRIIGLDHAIDALIYTNSYTATDALDIGLIDAKVAHDDVFPAALKLMQWAIGDSSWSNKQNNKKHALAFRPVEKAMLLYARKEQILADFPIQHMPTGKILLDALLDTIDLDRTEAYDVIQNAMLHVLDSPTRHAVHGLSEAKSIYQQHLPSTRPFQTLAWLGEGYNHYLEHLFVQQPQLNLIIQAPSAQIKLRYAEFAAQWAQQYSIEELTTRLQRIDIANDHASIAHADVIFDTDVSDLPSKLSVLYGLDKAATPTYIVTLHAHQSINALASASHHPIHLIGTYFFHDFYHPQLVEVVCHDKTSAQTLEDALQFIQQLGHTPLIVKDRKGRFIHRVLSAYFFAFNQLIDEGISAPYIDQLLEDFGWTQGPAALADQIGIETCLTFQEQLQAKHTEQVSCFKTLYDADRLGQNNLKGFYAYQSTNQGSFIRSKDSEVADLLPQAESNAQISAQSIIDRLMIALCNEVLHSVSDQTVSYATDADLAAVLAFGFPKHLGGPCRYVEHYGLREYIALCNTYAHLGAHYHAPNWLHDVVEAQTSLFQEHVL
ncbi:fatty acid oxidation complex subunit alpha FadB [Acinetobacter apis]|uniref:3-hydroxyacyl-CoA dehydrogenase n=1 Tax=Acinetobacter apis TaxID=1229165 RepID=A0A217EGR0_9GAMM|nr:3-hydroxyacyl-CoA dehydrogenase NAD-binding domain-containing protein [Acinetobacter apis]SNQ29699.1 3-hydroxyacyl-CoA dehydrogenase [Acinetobacter apis]